MIKLSKTSLFFFLISSFCSFGQKQFLLFIKNNHRKVTYQKGEIISFRLKGDDMKITERILGFEGDSLLVFDGLFKVNPKEISDMYVDEKTSTWFIFRYKYSKVLPMAGVGYLLLDVVNTEKFNKSTLITSGSLISAGLLAKWLIKDRIKIKGQRKLGIIW